MYRRLLLLGLLRQREMHGYRLNEFIDRFLQVCSDLKKPTAYFLLDKMAAEGYVRASADREGRYPERKIYSITPEGEAYFLSLLRENLASFDRVRYPGDIGLAFLHELPPEERVALMRERMNAVRSELAGLESVPPHGGALDLVMDRNRTMLKAEIDWLEQAAPRVAQVKGLHQFAPSTTESTE